jgi:hypothetical protein
MVEVEPGFRGGLKGSAHHPDVEEVRRLGRAEAAVSRGERREGEPEGEL